MVIFGFLYFNIWSHWTCGTVGRATTSYTRGLRFKSSHNFVQLLFTFKKSIRFLCCGNLVPTTINSCLKDNDNKLYYVREVVVAQLVERSLTIP